MLVDRQAFPLKLPEPRSSSSILLLTDKNFIGRPQAGFRGFRFERETTDANDGLF